MDRHLLFLTILFLLWTQTIKAQSSGPCSCNYRNCSCCIGFTPPNLNPITGCVNFMLMENIGLKMQTEVDGTTLAERQIDVDEPSPLCVSIPGVPGIEFCAQVYDFHVGNDYGKGCVKLLFKVLEATAARTEIGCIDFQGTSISYHGP